jgi:S-adenosylmethionine:tRNA ribosyltransferase-isomerase
MTDPRTILIKDYTYVLPEERIAKYPLPERDASKLLIYKEGKITEDIYRNIAGHLPPESGLIFKDTKVIEARLLFQKLSGGVIELFCLEPHDQYSDITTAMMQPERVLWKCLVGGASKWKHGQVLEMKIIRQHDEFILTAKYIAKAEDSFIIELSWNDPALSFSEVLHLSGAIPLPPYIKRNAEENDSVRYQTIYAHHDGSVAAPTAGLHFTDSVFKTFGEKKIKTDYITLHVGAGTFKPVKTEILQHHEMHAEFFSVSKKFIQNLIDNIDKKIIAVGTTTLRTIESLYWLGVKRSIVNGEWSKAEIALITQWEGYELKNELTVKESLECLVAAMEKNKLENLVAKTQIIIAPGYKFKIVNGLATNFHQPGSTLLLLIAAFTGNDWRKIYDYALKNEFRFLSYGDGCLLWNNQE